MLLNTGGLLCGWGALVSHAQLTAYPPFCRAALHTIGPSCYCCKELFLPMRSTSHVPLLNFIRFLLTHSCNLSRTLWMMALSSNISTGVPYLGHLVTCQVHKYISNIPSAHWYIKWDLSQVRPLQYSTSYWPLTIVARIIKSCLEMHSKACQWHEILLPEFWASRSGYKLRTAEGHQGTKTGGSRSTSIILHFPYAGQVQWP